MQSLSARRAWIEMLAWYAWDGWQTVALRKESVDRNDDIYELLDGNKPSLSARRAWIEILARWPA